MTTVYAVAKFVNEWYMDDTGKKAVQQVGAAGTSKKIAYANTLQGAIEFLNGYMDEEMDLNALCNDTLTKSKKSGFPKRQIDYECFDDNGVIRHRISLCIVTAETILADCLWKHRLLYFWSLLIISHSKQVLI
jgi:hypothetical protein